MKSTISRTEHDNRLAAAGVIVTILAITAGSYLVRDTDGPANALLTFFTTSVAGILNLFTACLLGVQYLYNGKRYFALFGNAFLFRGLCMLTLAALIGHFLPASDLLLRRPYLPVCLWFSSEMGFAVFVTLSAGSFLRTRHGGHTRPSYGRTLAYGVTALGAWAVLSYVFVGMIAKLPQMATDSTLVATLRFSLPLVLIVTYGALMIYIFRITRLTHKLFLLVWVILGIGVCEFVVTTSSPNQYSYQWYAGRLLSLASPAIAMIALTWEITRQYQSLALTNTDLVEKVFIDPLTNIYNRRYFETRILHTADSAHRLGVPLSLLLIDIDFFKQVNDRYGHPFGDTVLQRIARTIEHCIRQPGDFAARLGGEEFAVVLPELDEHAALNVSNRIRDAVRLASTDMLPPASRERGEIITVSVGIATWHPDSPLNIEDMLSRADRALYEAKHKGRNQSVLSQPELVEAYSVLDTVTK